MARPSFRQRVADERAQRETQHRVRMLRTVTRRDGARSEVDGRWLLNFCGNDYLGLSQQFSVGSALQDGAARHGFGSTGSALVCGRHAAHEALEHAVAEWLGYPRALLFDSGYVANLAVLQAFLGEGDIVVQDRLDHASLIDGARLSGAMLRRYPHGDPEGALRQLRSNADGAAMVATDGVFSMDGDIAPLKQLALIARVQHATLYVDDAHGVGVVGEEGRGCVAAARLGTGEVPLQLVTLGKALGGHGAVVVGEADMIEHLVQSARGFIYSTAPPPALAMASLEAVKLARRDEWRREKLRALIAQIRERMQQFDFELPESTTPIQPVPCGDERTALAMSAALEEEGFWVTAIRPPTVPDNGSRLRVTLSALHTADDVDALVKALVRVRERVSVR
ncbi:8-amino-7-oxononanoate synthase [Solilutibacter silvestris]|uniref:8-amino-7-oxononanoate synthase n=1 Tax=Solilutibacter silvestris TaxID=1645665 RepID=A0A2K1Q0X6_9GAMM|nr:8-amino-7-oxononanoate synthase [Lysobacter silvestris]PNS08698.1 bioF: 8-amino-7-oxononanoate synthase [Lysobacter silvestris]